MIWNQHYYLFGHGLAFSATIAALPIFTLLFLLGVMRKSAWVSGLAGLAVTLLVAIVGYQMPPGMALNAAAYGAAFGLFPISWIIFWAIALFRLTVETGKFEIIRDSVGRLTPDPRLQAILIAFAFGAFLEGASGFGTPVAIAATMLTGLGFSAFSASAICLLANTAPVAFGAIGIPVITLAGTTGLPLAQLSAEVGRVCAPISLVIPAYVIVATGGFVSLSGIWLPTMVCGAVFAGMQFTISNFIGPQLTDIIAALSSMLALVIYLHFRHPEHNENSGAIRNCLDKGFVPVVVDESANKKAAASLPPQHSLGEVLYAWMPYGFLVACVLLWGVGPIQHKLNLASFTVAWPTGEFGGMGLEGYVRLGFRKEMEAIADPVEREKYYQDKVAQLYANGKAVSIASVLEIDEVIDPAETRDWIMAGLRSVPTPEKRTHRKRPCIDTW
ncbi:MAG: L-lactate permease [Rhizobiales bacterium]|nr:L-lactate permease [Hyphomicrobiales bacterium]